MPSPASHRSEKGSVASRASVRGSWRGGCGPPRWRGARRNPCQATIPPQPSEGAFHDPTPWRRLKAVGGMRGSSPAGRPYPASRLADRRHTVPEILLDPGRCRCPDIRHQRGDDVRRGSSCVMALEHQPGSIPIATSTRRPRFSALSLPYRPADAACARSFLGRVVATRPPFSVVLADWLSRMPARRLARRARLVPAQLTQLVVEPLPGAVRRHCRK